MNEFKQYRRKQVAELRHVTEQDIKQCSEADGIVIHKTSDSEILVSISGEDKKAGSPRIGDMIARNPKNHLDQWLVAEQYFKDNFEPVK